MSVASVLEQCNYFRVSAFEDVFIVADFIVAEYGFRRRRGSSWRINFSSSRRTAYSVWKSASRTMNDETLRCIASSRRPLSRRDGSRRREGERGVSREIRDAHVRTHYAKNMVIILPRPSKTAPCIWNMLDRSCDHRSVFLSFLFISPLLTRPRRATAFRVYSFSLFKAPHPPRSWERAPYPPDTADWIQMRPSCTRERGRRRNSRRISSEKQEREVARLRERNVIYVRRDSRDLKISRAYLVSLSLSLYLGAQVSA